MINVWTTRLTELIDQEGKEIASNELHPGRYLHHTKVSQGYKPLLQGLVDKADQLKVSPNKKEVNIQIRKIYETIQHGLFVYSNKFESNIYILYIYIYMNRKYFGVKQFMNRKYFRIGNILKSKMF